MNKYNATITHINTKIFTWKTRCGKNHGILIHLKTSTITNNGFTIVLPQIQLRVTTYIYIYIYNNLFLEYNNIKGSNVRKKLTTLTAPVSVKTISFHTTNLQSNRSEWRVTCLEVAVQILARSNGERTGNRRKKTDCSAASSSFFLTFFSSVFALF